MGFGAAVAMAAMVARPAVKAASSMEGRGERESERESGPEHLVSGRCKMLCPTRSAPEKMLGGGLREVEQGIAREEVDVDGLWARPVAMSGNSRSRGGIAVVDKGEMM